MSIGAPNRACGRCGAPVTGSGESCQACGALLAAYEPPRGSEEAASGTLSINGSALTIDPPITTTPPDTHRETIARPESGPGPAWGKASAPPAATAPERASGRQEAHPVVDKTTPVRRARPQPSLPRESTPRLAPMTRQQSLPHGIPSIAASIAKVVVVALAILVVFGILDFDVVPILILAVGMLSLLAIMRSAAKASGRKTTAMHDPKRRDSRRR